MKDHAGWAEDYIRAGWSLVAIPAGSKAPRGMGWQQPEKAINTLEQAREYYERNPTHNMGLLHIASGTIALDIDNVEHTRIIFAGLGIDYDAVMAGAPRIVGRQGRGKALFKAPHDRLATHKISWPREGDPRHNDVVFELRAGAVQDVLPPSIHPDTGKPYRWDGPAPLGGLPPLPHQLLSLWENWDRLRPQLMALCPWRPTETFRPPAKPRLKGDGTSIIDAFNDAHDMRDKLIQNGYKPVGKDRFLSPNSSSGLAGVVLFEDGRAYSHHASDPFDNAHTFDAFDVWCQYVHLGDVSKAVRDAAQFLHLDNDPALQHDQEAIDHGKAVAAMIFPAKRKAVDRGPLSDIPEHLLSVPGVLQDAVNYYSVTAPRDQPQFAVQTALAFGSVVMGRRWVTDQANMTGLYFVNVGLSAAGKEHSKTTLERMLEAAGLARLIGPAGYTSASGVFSALLDQPSHAVVIDEFGRLMQSSQSGGQQHKIDAQTILMEVFARQTGTLRPQGFSKMGMTNAQAKQMDKFVTHPSLTLLAMTTPSTLYEGLSSKFITDGFLGRFLIVESKIGRQLSRRIRMSHPSERLTQWARECAEAHEGDLDTDSADIPPTPVLLPFSEACWPILEACEVDMHGEMDAYQRFGTEAMFGRTKEIAHRLALIVARSKGESEISAESMNWAVDYATFYAKRMGQTLLRNMSDSGFEDVCKKVYALLEKAGLKGMTERDLSRGCRPYAGMKPRERKEVMEALVSDRGVVMVKASTGGRTRLAWIAPPDEHDE